MSYIGRFAPSPTGSLHFGSLVAAVASYCDARSNSGKWLLRMEDLDKPREIKGAANDILRTLEAYGFTWDKAVIYQSKRSALYENALNTLQKKDLIYPCTCTRKEIADSRSCMGIDGVIYPKTCLLESVKPNKNIAWRIKTNQNAIYFYDTIQGKISHVLNEQVGDFILKRADGFFAYQLAVIVDDAAQGVTQIVRGADLLDSTTRQIYLQQQLNFAIPHYAHVPIVNNLAGEKLSKQTLAEPIIRHLPTHQLFRALSFLGQNPPLEIKNTTLNEVWFWAITHWNIAKVPRQTHIKIPH